MASDDGSRTARYEYRVWGKHRKARKALARLADDVTVETVEDCYLLADDPSWNAKVRDDRLKIKRLIDEERGFERWTSRPDVTADTAPTPFDEVYDALRLDRPRRGKSYDLRQAAERLDPDGDVRAVFVEKHRRRYRIGDLRAEVTDIELLDAGDVLRTISIEGDDLDELVALRKRLGLRGEPNIAVHQFIDAR